MSWSEEWRERRRRRRERFRRLIFGVTPRPKLLERLLLVLSVVVLGFTCYYFRLVHAATFEVIAIGCVIAYFVLRRIWWSRKMARTPGGQP
jgi:hypothetical protein